MYISQPPIFHCRHLPFFQSYLSPSPRRLYILLNQAESYACTYIHNLGMYLPYNFPQPIITRWACNLQPTNEAVSLGLCGRRNFAASQTRNHRRQTRAMHQWEYPGRQQEGAETVQEHHWPGEKTKKSPTASRSAPPVVWAKWSRTHRVPGIIGCNL